MPSQRAVPYGPDLRSEPWEEKWQVYLCSTDDQKTNRNIRYLLYVICNEQRSLKTKGQTENIWHAHDRLAYFSDGFAACDKREKRRVQCLIMLDS
jgi:hypothetical protein